MQLPSDLSPHGKSHFGKRSTLTVQINGPGTVFDTVGKVSGELRLCREEQPLAGSRRAKCYLRRERALLPGQGPGNARDARQRADANGLPRKDAGDKDDFNHRR
jgi:hypothetical protein